jgi:CheY-like chemotaxis protein
VINGYSNLLLDKQDLPPHVVESLKHIFVAGGRAANLTRQLLIFSRKSHPHNQSLDLNEVVDAVIAMLRRMIGENIRLEVDLARPLPRIMADAGMLEQIMMNLAVNARDAMPKGGSLVLSTGSCEATAADCAQNPEAKPGAYVMLGVRDTGYGIPPEILPRIFEPFFTTKEEGKGTGLGLATVFGIARQHQGWVEVESEVGTGTLFQVFFPVATEAQSAHLSPASENILLTGGKETILLVEDEESVRSFARTVLEMHGYKVLEAGTGIEALDAWKWYHDKISLLLTDLVLPDEITGHELAERLQVEKPELRVLYSSGYNPAQARDVLKLKTGFCFLQKPYQPKTLARIVREVLDNGTVNSTSPSQAPFA